MTDDDETHLDWPQRLIEGRRIEPYDRGILWPTVTLRNADRYRASKLGALP